jgi:GNAT superfamily N-acetyltransferase
VARACDPGRDAALMRLTAGRVTLRPVRHGDFSQIGGWYDSAKALAHSEQSLEARFEAARTSGCELLGIFDKDGEVAGLMDYRINAPADGWLTTAYIAIADGRRGFGYGSEAIRALEAKVAKLHAITNFMAEVNVNNGLGLYFWLRVGYRPATAEEVFWRDPREGGIIAMIRGRG